MMDMQILENPELSFAVVGIISSSFCGRISLVYARGGIFDRDFFSLIFGTVANFAWVSSFFWFYLEGNWLIPLIAMLISLFGFNLLITPDRHYFYRIRNMLRVIPLISLFGMWHSEFIY